MVSFRNIPAIHPSPEIEDSTESKGDPISNGGATSAEKVAIASQAVVQPPLI